MTGGGKSAALAAKAATAAIPIVFNVGSDPVKAGLVTSLGRPGGNATGVNILTEEIEAKRLGLLKDEVIARGRSIAHLVNPGYAATETNVREVAAAANVIGRHIVLLRANSEAEIDAAFAAMSQARVGAVLVGADPFFNGRRSRIVDLAAQYAIQPRMSSASLRWSAV